VTVTAIAIGQSVSTWTLLDSHHAVSVTVEIAIGLMRTRSAGARVSSVHTAAIVTVTVTVSGAKTGSQPHFH
jgi:hypothetical protein